MLRRTDLAWGMGNKSSSRPPKVEGPLGSTVVPVCGTTFGTGIIVRCVPCVIIRDAGTARAIARSNPVAPSRLTRLLFVFGRLPALEAGLSHYGFSMRFPAAI